MSLKTTHNQSDASAARKTPTTHRWAWKKPARWTSNRPLISASVLGFIRLYYESPQQRSHHIPGTVH